MKYDLIENNGEYAIVRTKKFLGLTIAKERCYATGSLVCWVSNNNPIWDTTCWSDDLEKVEKLFSRIAGESKVLHSTESR